MNEGLSQTSIKYQDFKSKSENALIRDTEVGIIDKNVKQFRSSPVIQCNNQLLPAYYDPYDRDIGCFGNVKIEASAENPSPCSGNSQLDWTMLFYSNTGKSIERIGSSFVNALWLNQWITVPKLLHGQINPIWQQIRNQYPDLILEDVLYVTYIKPTNANNQKVQLSEFRVPLDNIIRKVVWKASDQCGKGDECLNSITIVDRKAPTTYFYHELRLNVYCDPLELVAKKFDRGSFDNCTPAELLRFTFEGVFPVDSLLNKEHYFKKGLKSSELASVEEYKLGIAQKWDPSVRSSSMLFLQVGYVDLKVHVWDENGNSDYSDIRLLIADLCDKFPTYISGDITTPVGNNVKDVNVILSCTTNGNCTLKIKTNERGEYGFDISKSDYVSFAQKDDDYLNGVSTLDAALLQRHILGIQPFIEPFQWIAADINNDTIVNMDDLVEMRKVILGIIPKFSNSSWRFPIKNQKWDIPDVLRFEEKYNYVIQYYGEIFYNRDFIGVKIGDLDYSATTGLKQTLTEVRRLPLVLEIKPRAFKSGELISVPVISGLNQNTFGYQLTMNTDGLELVNIEPGKLDINMQQVGLFPDLGKMTMSYAAIDPIALSVNDVLFTLVFKANEDGNIEQSLKVNSDITVVESYDEQYQVGGVELRNKVSESNRVELYQNQPNPFQTETSISFYLPSAAEATLSVHDVLGKLIKQYPITGVKGLNTIEIKNQELGVSGVLYYTLKSGDFSFTKKMIIVD